MKLAARISTRFLSSRDLANAFVFILRGKHCCTPQAKRLCSLEIAGPESF